jgi:hypothetical protein
VQSKVPLPYRVQEAGAAPADLLARAASTPRPDRPWDSVYAGFQYAHVHTHTQWHTVAYSGTVAYTITYTHTHAYVRTHTRLAWLIDGCM